MNDTIYIDTTKEDSSITTNYSITDDTSRSPDFPLPIEVDTSKPIAEDHPDHAQLVHSQREININTSQGIDASSFNTEFRYTDQQRLEESFNALKREVPKEHHGVLQNFWDNVLGPTIAQGIINPLMDPMMLLGAGRGKVIAGTTSRLSEVRFPSEVKRGSYSGSYEGTETMPQQQQAFLTYGKAAGLDSNKMLKAMEMKDAGASPDKIYKTLGAEFYEGKWGERVPYSGMELKHKPDLHDSYNFNESTKEFIPTGKQDAFYTVHQPTTVGEVASLDKVFKADPTIKDIKVRSMTPVEQDRYDPGTFGFADGSNNTIVLRPNLPEQQFKTSIVHEIEHIIQERHGLPQGSAMEMFRDSSYRTAEAQQQRSYLELADKVHQLQYFKGQATEIPKFTSETVGDLFTIVNKGRFNPKALDETQLKIYKDIVKSGLEEDFMALDEKTFALKLKDLVNQRKYLATKGEVASRVGEDEVGKTAEEVSKLSYNKTMNEKVPAKERLDSPLDVGFPQGQDFGSVYRHEGHYLNPDQARRLYTAKPELRPIPPGFSKEHIQSLDAKQYLGLVDYLKKDSTYNLWRRSGDKSEYFSMNPQIQALYKKLKISGSNDNKNIGSQTTLQSQRDIEKMSESEFKQYMKDKEDRFKKSMITPTE